MAFSLLGEYYVEDDCTPYSEFRFNLPSGPIKNGVRLSPNPAADVVTLRFDDTWVDESVNIRILDVSGRQIQMNQGAFRTGGEVQLSVSSLHRYKSVILTTTGQYHL